MTVQTPYPVLTELRLPPVARRFPGRSRRDLSELPTSPPGTALVFQAGGRFIVFDEQQHLTGTEDFVLGALAVAVVDVRRHAFAADLILPSARPGEQFAIRATFDAAVTQPDQVVRQGAVDLPEELGRHLRRDPKLAEICSTHTIEQIAEVRILAENRITAYYNYRAYKQEGISLALQLVEVMTPVELEERVRRQRTVELDHEFQQQIDEFEHKKKLWLMQFEQEQRQREDAFDRDQRMRAAELERDFEARNAARDREEAQRQTEWDHREKLLKVQRDQAVHELNVKAEELETERAKRYVEGGVTDLLSWALAKGQISPLEMAEMRRGDDLRAVQQINELVNRLLNGPNGDLVTVDVQVLLDDLLERLTGHKQLRDDKLAVEGSDLDNSTAIGSGRPGRPEDENPPDEDDFVD